jgi:hypothetical protein
VTAETTVDPGVYYAEATMSGTSTDHAQTYPHAVIQRPSATASADITRAGFGAFSDDVAVEARLGEDFKRLADQWIRETGHESFTARAARHDAYQQIIGMGHEVIPFILKDLRTQPSNRWFLALNAITREMPIPPESYGKVSEMTQAWLRWGAKRRYK